MYRLQTVRYESLELTEQILKEKQQEQLDGLPAEKMSCINATETSSHQDMEDDYTDEETTSGNASDEQRQADYESESVPMILWCGSEQSVWGNMEGIYRLEQ